MKQNKSRIFISNIKSILTIIIILILTILLVQCTGNKEKGAAPVATNVKITGSGFAGEELTGVYTFTDENEDDKEAQSIYRWLENETKDGEYREISEANQKKYTPTLNQIGMFIKFEVTPVSTAEPTTGEPVMSAAIQIKEKIDTGTIGVEDGYTIVNVNNQEEFEDALDRYRDQDKVKFKLAEGTYDVDETFNGVNTHWIEGKGKDKTIIRGNIRYNESDKIKVTDLSFDHKENVGEQYCLAFDKSTNVEVDNLDVSNAIEHGIYATESQVDIKNTEFNNNGASNIYYGKGSSGTVSNVTSNGAVTLDGISVSNSTVTVENSNFNANNQTGIFFYNNSTGNIINCSSTGNQNLHGVEIKDSEVNIEGGTYSDNGQSGIQYLNSKGKITGVTAENNKKLQGIQVQNSTVDIEQCTTSGNEQSGVYIFGNSNVNILNLQSTNNKINGVKVENSIVNITNSKKDSDSSSRRTEFKGISNNTESGISYRAKASGIVTNITSKSSEKFYGIEIKNSNVTIEESNFETNGLGGTRIFDNSKVTIKTNSTFNKNKADGLLIENSEVTIENSEATNNDGFGLLTISSIVSLSNVTISGNKNGNIENIDGSSTINVIEN